MQDKLQKHFAQNYFSEPAENAVSPVKINKIFGHVFPQSRMVAAAADMAARKPPNFPETVCFYRFYVEIRAMLWYYI